ncbi:hypothetical protein HZH68_015244 [Vespula germanica]|uniref:Uncharacterized protein n=1 Tax=Vespula germanica TaxID=30212 RepID=A0A834MRX0_VESGE|nr:hypothetical protein HZH68_015244 [Vespula germanica]
MRRGRYTEAVSALDGECRNSPWVANNKRAKLREEYLGSLAQTIARKTVTDSWPSEPVHPQFWESSFMAGGVRLCRVVYIVGSAVCGRTLAPADARGFGSDAAGVLGLRESREPTDVRNPSTLARSINQLTAVAETPSKLQKVSECEFLSPETYGLAGKTTGKTKRLNFTSSPVHLLWLRVL